MKSITLAMLLTTMISISINAHATTTKATMNHKASSHEHMAHLHGVHTSAIGVHGMALLATGKKLVASHMPLANSIHSHQILFTFKVSDAATSQINTLNKTHALLSIVPERFDLVKLMNGTLTSFNADIYSGHFERNGKKVISGVNMTVERILLSESLSQRKNGLYYVVPVDPTTKLLVHRISQQPSFDQVLLAKPLDPKIDQQLPDTIRLTQGNTFHLKASSDLQLKGWEIVKQLYLETADFQ